MSDLLGVDLEKLEERRERLERENKRIDEAFRNVAASPDGQIVLKVLFARLGLLSLLKTEEDRIRHNVAVDIQRLFDGAPGGEKRASDLLVEQIAERAGSSGN